jgi:hypothetical protein
VICRCGGGDLKGYHKEPLNYWFPFLASSNCSLEVKVGTSAPNLSILAYCITLCAGPGRAPEGIVAKEEPK